MKFGLVYKGPKFKVFLRRIGFVRVDSAKGMKRRGKNESQTSTHHLCRLHRVKYCMSNVHVVYCENWWRNVVLH